MENYLLFAGGVLSLIALIAVALIEDTGGKPKKIPFAIISGLAAIFSLIGGYCSSEKNEDQTAQIKALSDSTNTNVTSIKSQLENAQEALGLQLRSLDSLNAKLEASTASALKSIETTKGAVSGFYKVSEQLKRAADEERKKLDLGKPKVFVFEHPIFMDTNIVSKDFKLEFSIFNLAWSSRLPTSKSHAQRRACVM